MKIAVVGSSGLLGIGLCEKLDKLHDVRGFSRAAGNVDFDHLEISLCHSFEQWTPDVIVNAVALVNLLQCENDWKHAKEINIDMAVAIASAAKKTDAYNIHISTDHYYYDEHILHDEFQTVKLFNRYAESKYLSEQKVLETYSKSIVARTNIIGFRSWTKPSFFDWLVGSLKKQTQINMYTDYATSPISVGLLSGILIQCAEKEVYGLYNAAGSEVISKYDFAMRTADVFGFSKDCINTAIIRDEVSAVKRAVTLGLDVSRIEKEIGISMPKVDDSLSDLLKKYTEMPHE